MTYYDVLGVPRDADIDQLKRAYWNIARRTHSDVGQGFDDEGFRRAKTAYQVLSSPKQRSDYDAEIAAIDGVHELLGRHPAGLKVLQSMLPAAPITPVPGRDLIQVVNIPKEKMENGGSFTVTVKSSHNRPPTTVTIEIPAGASSTPWCVLADRGQPGNNNAPSGRLFIYCVSESSP
jgi:curved DNA-binding protein CbpA